MREQVKKIIDTGYNDGQIDQLIGMAGVFLSEAHKGLVIETTLTENIQVWLAAHMIASTGERLAVEEQAGPARARYADIFGEGLKSTPYGQMAVEMDVTGRLRSISEGRSTVKMTAL